MKDSENEDSDFLKDKLFNYEETAGENAWNRLKNDLDKKDRKMVIWWWLFPVLLLIGSAGFWFGVNPDKQESVLSQTEKTIDILPKEEVKDVVSIESQQDKIKPEIKPALDSRENSLDPRSKKDDIKNISKGESSLLNKVYPSTIKAESKGTGTSPVNSNILSQAKKRHRNLDNRILVQMKSKQNKPLKAASAFKEGENIKVQSRFEMENQSGLKATGKEQSESQTTKTELGIPTYEQKGTPNPVTGKIEQNQNLASESNTENQANQNNVILGENPILTQASVPDSSSKAATILKVDTSTSLQRQPDSSVKKTNEKRLRFSVHLSAMGLRQQASLQRELPEFDGQTMERFSGIVHSPKIEISGFGNWKCAKTVFVRLGIGLGYWSQQMTATPIPGLRSEAQFQESASQPGYFVVTPFVANGSKIKRTQHWLMYSLTPQMEFNFGYRNRFGLRAGPQFALLHSLKQTGSGKPFTSNVTIGGSYGILYRRSNWEIEAKLLHQFQKQYALPGLENAEASQLWIGIGCGYWF